jgi:hypothetical protein
MKFESAQEIIQKHFGNPILQNSKLLFLAPYIPHDKINNAIKSMAEHVNPADVLLLYDTSIMHSGKTGILLTRDALYCKNFYCQPVRIEYAELFKVAFSEEELSNTLSINKKISFTFTTNDQPIGTLIHDILEEIIKNKKGFEAAQSQYPPYSKPIDQNLLSNFAPNTEKLFFILCLIPCIFPVAIPFIFLIPMAYIFYRYIDKIAVYQLEARPINLDSKLYLGRVKIYQILNEVLSSLNLNKQILIYEYQSKEVNSLMLPTQGGFILFITTTALNSCTPKELKGMLIYNLVFTDGSDFHKLLKMFSLFLSPYLYICLLFKALYFPIFIRFRFIPIKWLSSFLTGVYKSVVEFKEIRDRVPILLLITYLFFPLGAIIITKCTRKLIKRADMVASNHVGYIYYKYTISNAYRDNASFTPMDIEFSFLKFKWRFYGLLVSLGLKKRLRCLQ